MIIMFKRLALACAATTAAGSLVAALAAQQAAAGVGRPGDHGYLVVKGTQLWKVPSPSAEIAGMIVEATCVMRATDVRDTGWVLLEPVKNELADQLPNDPPIKREPCHRIEIAGWTK